MPRSYVYALQGEAQTLALRAVRQAWPSPFGYGPAGSEGCRDVAQSEVGRARPQDCRTRKQIGGLTPEPPASIRLTQSLCDLLPLKDVDGLVADL